jgi:hypothetical protein
MSNVIRIKRRTSGAAGAPASLVNAELAFNEVDNILYYGKGTGGTGGTATTIEAIAGYGAYVSLTSTQTISGNKTFTGTVNLSGATISGNTTFSNNLTVSGDLTVNGTLTSISSATLEVEDKNIELGKTTTPTDTTADGGGITLLGTTNKTINWIDATDAWTFSEHIDIASGKEYRINGSKVLDATSLGSGVVSSSLTSVGTIGTGTWQGTTIGIAYGGTGAADAATARTNLGLAIGTDVQAYDADLDTLSGMQTGAATALAALTATEIAILDGATVTTTELNIIDGSTSAVATTLAATDTMVVNDGGTMVQVALSDLVTFLEDGATSGFNIDGGTY